jgi:hypothetical protein
MNGDDAHIIDIDHMVLTEMDLRTPFRARALIEAEVRRALAGTELRTLTERGNETRVAGEVARSVVQAVGGRE